MNLNLNEIGADKIIFFNMKCHCEFEEGITGQYFISHLDDENETLLFRNYVPGENYSKSHKVILLKFEFIDYEWVITPINKYFKHKKDRL